MSTYSPTGTRWLVDPTDPDLVLYETEHGDTRWLCEMHHAGDGSDDERDHARDARAIALAPEMHAFINRLAAWESPNPPQSQRAGGYDEAMSSVATLARALLAKIEGGGS